MFTVFFIAEYSIVDGRNRVLSKLNGMNPVFLGVFTRVVREI